MAPGDMVKANGAIYPSLRDRVVFITGGASGIGAAIVAEFCRQGARVSFVDIDCAAAETLGAGLAAEGLAAPRFLECDLTDVARLKTAIGEVIDRDGPIRVLVNNAANDDRHEIDAVTPDYFDQQCRGSGLAMSRVRS